MDKETALAYAALHEALAAAREAINKKCFRGGNENHRKALEQARNAAKNCQKIADRCC